MIVLASSSLVRARLLEKFGVDFIQKPVDFDENTIYTKNPKEFAYQATLGKFKTAIETLGIKTPLLCADTVINTEGILQRKAVNIDDAKAILSLQNGKNIEVLTCMMYKSEKLEFIDISSTQYKLATFNIKALQRYLDSKKWEGKAGCVMIEGFHKDYIISQKGLESTALGLSVEKILPFLGLI
ncbi:septum formation inhibitor Maf [Helicobacter cappadocius]|uniref:Septum formation inhibitor Maf n=1 Tax=Helicobacter cappadocius TaxID=3063998 RepID=A0AA90PRT7_9HELI|nr:MULTISPECIES: septum formation inhibitor Maf [unclassified Helicobacter]MDO7252452.1 septum formation inhibitor Maf [Helicobacter sp. faydin-H75]MDP2538319.1 septum formation inhibitor Maf [Helicobacter sp. faydin-H76]